MNTRAVALTLILILSTFSNAFAPIPTSVLDEPVVPQLAGNTVDCGTNASNLSFEVEAYQSEWNRHDTVSAFLDTYCGIWNSTYRVDWFLTDEDNGTFIQSGQQVFETNSTSVTHMVSPATDHFNEVDVHFPYMETGNYSIKGSFWVMTNTVWNWLANASSTFQVNSTNTTTACGYNDTLVSMETDVSMASYLSGESLYWWSDIECPLLATPYAFSWELYNLNTSSVFEAGWQNFTASLQSVNFFADGSGIFHDINLVVDNLDEGMYMLSTMLTLSDGSYIDSAVVNFSVGTNTTGGGGNQTNGTDCGVLWNNTYHITSVDHPLYGPNELVEWVIKVLCVTLGENYTLEWFLSFDENSSLLTSGAQTWTGVQSNVSGTGTYTIPTDPSALGNYTLISNLYHTNTSTLLNSNSVSFTVANGTNSTTNTTLGWGMNTNAWSSCINEHLFVNLTFNDPSNLTGESFPVYFDLMDAAGTNLSSTTVTVSMSSTGAGNYSFTLDLANEGLTHGTYTLRFTSEHTDPYTLSFIYGCTGCGYESNFTTDQFTEVWWQSYVTNTNGSSEAMAFIKTDVVFIGQPISWLTGLDCALFDTDYLVNMTFTDETGVILETFESIESPGPAPASGGGNGWNTRIKATGQIDTLGLPAGQYCIELTVMVEPYGTSDVVAYYNECITVMSFDDWEGCGTNISFFDHTQTFSGNPFVQQGLVFIEDSRIWIQNFYDCLVLGQSYNIHIVVSNESGEFKTFDYNYTISPNIISQTVWSTLVSWSEDIVAGTYCSEVTIHHTDNTFTQMIEEVYSTEDCFAVVNAGNGNWWENQGNDTGSPNNPIMPDVNCTELNNTLGNLSGLNAGWNMTDCESGSGFWFDVIVNGSNVTWYDPIYAVGYNYEVMVGPNVGSIIVPPGYGDDKFDLYLWENGEYVLVASDLDALTQYWFTDDGGISNSPTENEGVRKFSIRGLELSAQLDPEDDNAFVTGMSFVQNPNEQASLVMKMTPLTESDEDDDGIADDEDNCVNTANPNQADDNSNGVGDVCDETSPNYEPPTDATEEGGGGMTVLAVTIFVLLGLVAVAFFRKK
jgi:hypothetical protein